MSTIAQQMLEVVIQSAAWHHDRYVTICQNCRNKGILCTDEGNHLGYALHDAFRAGFLSVLFYRSLGMVDFPMKYVEEYKLENGAEFIPDVFTKGRTELIGDFIEGVRHALKKR